MDVMAFLVALRIRLPVLKTLLASWRRTGPERGTHRARAGVWVDPRSRWARLPAPVEAEDDTAPRRRACPARAGRARPRANRARLRRSHPPASDSDLGA